jgi:DNA end-binding protein Ku
MSVMPAPSADQAAAVPAAATPRGRASWSGLLRLSLVAVPVKAYPATTTTSETHCHQLHADCGQRIRYLKQCPVHGPVEAGAIVSGYAYAPDQYVVIDDDQLDRLRPAADRALCLEHFLAADAFDPALFAGRSLYLLPDGVVAHYPYAVLSAALRERHKWAVGRVVLSGHRRLALIRPVGNVLALHVLHYPAQVRPSMPWEADLRVGPVSAAEKDLAGKLIDAGSQPVEWSAYRDDRAEQLAALVQAALEKRPPTPAPAEPVPLLPLLEALQKSLAAARADQAPPPPAAAVNGVAPPQRPKQKRPPARRKS